MTKSFEPGTGKGTDDNLLEYRTRLERRKLVRKLAVPLLASFLMLILLILVLSFGFVVKSVDVAGETGYTKEELIEKSGITIGDNLFTVSEGDVSSRLKEAFPYIKNVTIEKDYPSSVTLKITEEYTTFYYEAGDEFFLFNHELRLMDKFDSHEALLQTRQAICVIIPLPKSYIVPQCIQFHESDAYVCEVIHTLSESCLVDYVTKLDLSDKFVLKMECGAGVQVELGDYTNLEGKFSALYSLLGENGSKMTGRVDLSCYPRCFYDLKENYDS